MIDPKTKATVTLEDLLRLKRAERPPEEFWAKFEAELRTKQLAAAVEKPRWWFGLPRWFAGISRHQMPLGAAAVLAVTFLVVRDYREPGLEAVSPSLGSAYTPALAGAGDAFDEVEGAGAHAYSPADAAPKLSPEAAAPAATPAPAAPPRPAVRTASQREDSPSARSIAANLAAADQSSNWDRVLSDTTRFALNVPTRDEPLAQVSTPVELRRERLFGYVAQPAEFRSNAEDRAAPIRERLASRINEDELYERVRRMNAGGNRLTLKF
jgi:hypothetical protein